MWNCVCERARARYMCERMWCDRFAFHFCFHFFSLLSFFLLDFALLFCIFGVKTFGRLEWGQFPWENMRLRSTLHAFLLKNLYVAYYNLICCYNINESCIDTHRDSILLVWNIVSSRYNHLSQNTNAFRSM